MNAKMTQPTHLDPGLSTILHALNQGKFDDAVVMAQSLSETPALALPARAIQAQAEAMRGEHRVALSLLADIVDPLIFEHCEILLVAGSAWFKLGQMASATLFLSRAHELDVDHPLINARLGACLMAVGNFQNALPLLKRATELMPQSAGVWLNLARVYLGLGSAEQALYALDNAESFSKKVTYVHRMSRIEALDLLGRHDEAELILKQACGADEVGSAAALAQVLSARGRHDEAWHLLREAIDTDSDNIDLLNLMVELAQVRGRFEEASHWLQRALVKHPTEARLWVKLASLSCSRLSIVQARDAADKALALTAEEHGLIRAQALAADAHVLLEEDQSLQAENGYRAALEQHEGCIPALNGLGHLLMQHGRIDEAITLFEQLKRVAPLQGWSQLIKARKLPDDPQVLERMASAARRPSMAGPVQSGMLFTLASAWEKQKDYDKAWQFAIEANAADKERLGYRPEVHRNKVEREIARFSADFMASRAGYGVDSSVPTFILGMPRSGTTLVEQILGSHSQVFGAGELSLIPELIQKLEAWEKRLGSGRNYPECVDDMAVNETRRFAQYHLDELQAYAPDASRIIDKLPHNFEHIGLIKLLFPNAKILHLKRQPRDVAISNFFTDYAAKFGGMGFAFDQRWLGEQLVDHQRLMTHWHQVFPGQILEVDYDALVDDVEAWAHRIIDFMDLPWEDDVLAFQQLDRAVKTASVWQVRQPVYSTSKAKWKRYQKHLEPLEATLAEIPPPVVSQALPRLPPGLFLSGMAHLQNKQPIEAQQFFEKLLQARPAHAAAHQFLGASLYQQGELLKASKAMHRSIELHQGNSSWYQNLLGVELALGNDDKVALLQQHIKRFQQGIAEDDSGGLAANTQVEHEQAPTQLVFETKRFVMRSLTPDDINEDYISWWNDPAIQEGLNSAPRAWGRTQAVAHVMQFNNRNDFHLGIFRKGTNRLIGFYAILLQPQADIAKINIVIGSKDFWGKGVPEELRPTVFQYLFEHMGIEKIKVEVVGHNRSSLMMCKRGGYVLEGVLRNEVNHFEAGKADLHVFGMLKDDWLNIDR